MGLCTHDPDIFCQPASQHQSEAFRQVLSEANLAFFPYFTKVVFHMQKKWNKRGGKCGAVTFIFLFQFFWGVVIFPRMGENSCTIYSWPVGLPFLPIEKISCSDTHHREWNCRALSACCSNAREDSAVCTGSPHYSAFWSGFACVPVHEDFGSQGKI